MVLPTLTSPLPMAMAPSKSSLMPMLSSSLSSARPSSLATKSRCFLSATKSSFSLSAVVALLRAMAPMARTLVEDLAAQGDGVGAGRAAGLGVLSRRVDLDVDGELGSRRARGEEDCARGVEELGFLGGVDAGDAKEVGDLGEVAIRSLTEPSWEMRAWALGGSIRISAVASLMSRLW
ncbi:hypothetical protein TOPH_01001 [Tolypocladium ophioglossoides CBS 100239]|uniref:Uncharacterized protein n=1 Tax=Tolypocladium ophioglossoides (strain CBS 100239) TaxID=1163406 RepID=A0A0L0NKH0_TOLOC|nr:hypothetical protein TOPH_01001 [Tolypocladium ophioglossoides CBS 100239]